MVSRCFKSAIAGLVFPRLRTMCNHMAVTQTETPHPVQHADLDKSLRPPLAAFALSALAGAVGVAVISAALFGADQTGFVGIVVGLAIYLVSTGTAGVSLMRTYPHKALGLCNIVTLVRLMIVAALAGALISGEGLSWNIFSLAAVALLLDGVDGWLARRQHLASSFGARFDMEVDAGFALVLALHAALAGSAGPVVIFLALPYYLFAAANLILPWLGRSLPERFSRKVVCVAQLAVLIALQLPIVTPGALDPLMLTVAVALAWSFGRDIVWLWRARP